MNEPATKPDIADRSRWVKAKPETLPEPSYWPFFLAMGLAFMLWGLLTSWIIGAVGGLVTVIALTGWIANLRHE